MADLATNIATQSNTQKDMQQSLVDQGGTPARIKQISGNITPEHRTTAIYKNVLDGSTLFWDDDNQGDWDDFYWAGDAASDGYSTYRETQRVVNKNNTFEESFETSTFIDPASTGNLNLSTYQYELDDGEELISPIIAKNNVAYTRVTINMDVSETIGTKYYISGNAGSSWQEMTLGTETVLSSTTVAGLRYKVTKTGTTVFPLTFPIQFSAGSTTIDNVQIKYS